jgi:TetR/AcrR family transcriptional regulator, cholesterol catabolism regulator
VRQERAVMSRWTSAVKAGITAGTFRADADAVLVTRSIGDVVLGAYRFMKPVGRMPADEVASQLASMILDGLDAR